MAHASALFPGLAGDDELLLKFCDIEFNGDEATVTRIWRRKPTLVKDLPPSETIESSLRPGQAVIAGDLLYAFVRPGDGGDDCEGSEVANSPSIPVDEPTPKESTLATALGAESGETEAVAETPPAEQAIVDEPRARKPDAALDESVSLTERLTRLSLMLCDQQERYMQQHVERVRRFDEYVQERERKLDVRCDGLAAAQERHLETLRSITADVTASVKLVGRQATPTSNEFPEGYTQARARLAASASQPVDLRVVAYQVGSFLSEAQSFLSGAPDPSNGGYP